MGIIQCPKNYNFWYILAYAGIDPVMDAEKYSYDEVTERLAVDVTQAELDAALAQYDHEAWLKELVQIKNPMTEEQQRLIDLELAVASILGGA
jgi:hypothetical protein